VLAPATAVAIDNVVVFMIDKYDFDTIEKGEETIKQLERAGCGPRSNEDV
jgi:hypothetical protein